MSSTHWGAKCVWISWGNCSGAWEAVPSCCCCTSLPSPSGGAWRSQWAVKRRTCCSPRCPTLPVTLVLSQQYPLKWSLSVLQKAHQGIHSTTCTEEELWNALPTRLYVLLQMPIYSICCVFHFIHVNWVFRFKTLTFCTCQCSFCSSIPSSLLTPPLACSHFAHNNEHQHLWRY